MKIRHILCFYISALCFVFCRKDPPESRKLLLREITSAEKADADLGDQKLEQLLNDSSKTQFVEIEKCVAIYNEAGHVAKCFFRSGNLTRFQEEIKLNLPTLTLVLLPFYKCVVYISFDEEVLEPRAQFEKCLEDGQAMENIRNEVNANYGEKGLKRLAFEKCLKDSKGADDESKLLECGVLFGVHNDSSATDLWKHHLDLLEQQKILNMNKNVTNATEEPNVNLLLFFRSRVKDLEEDLRKVLNDDITPTIQSTTETDAKFMELLKDGNMTYFVELWKCASVNDDPELLNYCFLNASNPFFFQTQIKRNLAKLNLVVLPFYKCMVNNVDLYNDYVHPVIQTQHCFEKKDTVKNIKADIVSQYGESAFKKFRFEKCITDNIHQEKDREFALLGCAVEFGVHNDTLYRPQWERHMDKLEKLQKKVKIPESEKYKFLGDSYYR